MPSRRHTLVRHGLLLALIVLGLYGLLAYVALPSAWSHYEHQRGLEGQPMLTHTGQGIPGDPLNVGLVGSQEDIVRAMHVAGWYPADPITFQTSLAIIGSVALDRPDPDAPVSALFYDGRREDLAFEKPVGSSADRRHHVRLWRVLARGQEDRPVWLGSATFDRGVGLSRYTGQVTHHIAPDIDAERDGLISDLVQAGMVEVRYQVSGIGPTLRGRNGEGDLYSTDGEIWIAVLVATGQRRLQPPDTLPSPALIAAKDAIWKAVMGSLPQR
ncbi:LssY C-terminal domain-containing protein [Microvirga puerhi]|uniref:LssY C-terminal domain-containing protein n=1 Tax=Microvirga puerhi TaxID=2876078 RepID=A0ABS7VSX2_9HYPH|nr:LssY C-terminal domain-containing protein [Microvirga puerhi]MBZ6078082.1 LssY C-terminal domain-containing protein [Microvirga puerhi]